jgi:hypothetical protein
VTASATWSDGGNYAVGMDPTETAVGPALECNEATVGQQLDRRRRAAAARWNLDNEIVLIGCGEPVPVPGRGARTYAFRSHSEYLYLTDRERAGGVLAFDPDDGWVDFVAPVTRDQRLWDRGGSDSEDGVPVSGLEAWLAERKGRHVGCLGAAVAGVCPRRGARVPTQA